jgi:anti-anti-sigma factor
VSRCILAEDILDGVTVVHLSGSLTQDCIPIMEKRFGELEKMKNLRLVIDIGDVEAITTPAITVFISATRAVAAGGGKMAFANVRGIVADIFTRCRLDVIFNIAGNVASAVKAVQP